MGQYISRERVKVRVNGKVRFTEDATAEPDKMSIALLDQLIREAEGQVEMHLSPRYSSPLRHDDGTEAGGQFQAIPNPSTKQIVVTLCELMATVRVLETDFGSGSPVDGDKYASALRKRYDQMVSDLMATREKPAGTNRWKYPPLPGLLLNYHNHAGDTGFYGQVLETHGPVNSGAFPQTQINSPGETFWNADLDEDVEN